MIEDIIEKIDLHRKRAKMALEELKEFNLNLEIFKDFEKIKTIDTFIYRFIKFQDMLGDKFFKIFLNELGEYKDSFSFIDVLDRLEKLGFIDNTDKFRGYRKLRNELTHEYPSNEEYILEGIREAILAFDELEKVFKKMINYYEKKLKN